jgi:glutamate-1-semialdehyde 2,1-aminomutase
MFLASTTHGAESSGLAAMMATVDVFLRTDVIGDNWRRGRRLMDGINAAAARHGLSEQFVAAGYPCLPVFQWRGLPEARMLEWKTLVMQELVKEGQICQGPMLLTVSHDDAVIDETVAAFDAALDRVAGAWATGSVKGFLEGPAIRPVFRAFQECVKGRCGRLHADEGKEACC